MIKSRKGKVSIKGSGGEVLMDLCVAVIGVRDSIAEVNDNDEVNSSKFVLSVIAKTLGVKVEFKKTGDNDA